MEIVKGWNNKKLYYTAFWGFLGWMLLGSIAYIVAILVVLFRGQTFEGNNIEIIMNSSEFYKASMVAETSAGIFLVVFAIVFFKKMFVMDAVKFKKDLWRNVAIIVVGSVLIIGLGNLLEWLYYLMNIGGESANQSLIEEMLNSSIRPIMFLMVVIIAPIKEELIFRKFLIGSITGDEDDKNVLAAIISILFFATIHVISSIEDLIFLPQYLLLSAIITLSYLASRKNIYVSVAMHFINNLIAFLVI